MPRELQPSWRDHLDRPVLIGEPPDGGAGSHYAEIGAFQGADYRRNAFAAATTVEIDALVGRLGLLPGMGVLDIGCGDGRHLRELARRGMGGLGIDLSEELVLAARAAAAAEGLDEVDFLAADAREFLAGWADGPPPFDAGLSLCQGAFGTSLVTDIAVMHGLGRHIRPGGVVALTAFHALFAARHLVDGDAFDPVTGRHHHLAEVHGPDGARQRWDLWTTAWTVRELAALAREAGLDVLEVVGCEPGRYDGVGVGLDDPELLLIARRPR
ncbi:MAG: SAM-dependent methyltransferase [Glaciecola sp.]|jgi:SAM-dependent methyltransferase